MAKSKRVVIPPVRASIKLAQDPGFDNTVGQLASNVGQRTLVANPGALTHEQRLHVASEHVSRERASVQARTMRLDAKIEAARTGGPLLVDHQTRKNVSLK